MKKKIILDMILNIAATSLPIALIQLIIYPAIAERLGNAEYGLMITMVSLFNLAGLPYGNVLNNIRLLQNNEYKENDVEGDFNVLLIVGLIMNSVIMIVGTIYYEEKFSYVSILFSIIVSALNLIREYLIVAFRISLNYKSILLNNAFLVIGYLVGFFIFNLIGYWQLIYLCGYLASLIYIIKNSYLIKEKYVVTYLFKNTAYKSAVLFFSTFLKSFVTYADKLVIYPLLGPVAVSVYYSSTILGKIISMGITPISSVFLSYLPNIKEINLKNFLKILSFTCVVGIAGYFVCIAVSKPLLLILYPDWAVESLELVNITTATAIIGAVCSVINPIILRFNNVSWQMTLSVTEITAYVIFTLLFYNLYGLKGFCVGILITNILKLFLMAAVYTSNLK
ncbi:MAG TPA: hypothetical protein DC038_05115 [Clostridiales bacterium]|nr:hypothetical protein [Clostridiales bacterium]